MNARRPELSRGWRTTSPVIAIDAATGPSDDTPAGSLGGPSPLMTAGLTGAGGTATGGAAVAVVAAQVAVKGTTVTAAISVAHRRRVIPLRIAYPSRYARRSEL